MTIPVSFRAFRGVKNLIPAAVAALLTATAAQAQVSEITATQLSALNPTAVPITGTPPLSGPTYTTTVGTQTLLFSDGVPASNKSLQRRDQQGGVNGGNFAGDFPVDTRLIANIVGVNTTGSADGLRIDFSQAVSAFGFNFDPNLFLAPTDFTLVVFEGLTQTSFTRTGVVNRAQGNNTAPFFGVQDAGGNAITAILLYGTSVPNQTSPRQVNTTPNDFAVGLLRFNISPTAPPVPEPGSVALLMGMAVTGASCLARRKRLTANK